MKTFETRRPALSVGPQGKNSASFSTLWAHLQDTPDGTWSPFSILVPEELSEELFDPGRTRDSSVSMPDFVMDQVETLGTFIVDGYVKDLRRLAGETREHYAWVIASIDRVSQNPDGILLEGKVVPFSRLA